MDINGIYFGLPICVIFCVTIILILKILETV